MADSGAPAHCCRYAERCAEAARALVHQGFGEQALFNTPATSATSPATTTLGRLRCSTSWQPDYDETARRLRSRRRRHTTIMAHNDVMYFMATRAQRGGLRPARRHELAHNSELRRDANSTYTADAMY